LITSEDLYVDFRYINVIYNASPVAGLTIKPAT
jgi:hypothetical protein